MGSIGPTITGERAWVTLVTSASYIPGAISLAFSLQKQSSKYPLVVLTTSSVPENCVRALEWERDHGTNLKVHCVETLKLPQGRKASSVASRFEDTWTKLRAFELTTYDRCVFLDADIVVYRNMDSVFEIDLPGSDWIAANHTCCCNLDQDEWAPSNWTKENCPYTSLSHPSALNSGPEISSKAKFPHSTYTLINGGMFLYQPSPKLWSAILHHFKTSPNLCDFQFPDQDFLAEFFERRWKPISWKYNAIKTMEYWHRNIWRDEEVHGLHYIVDKPWQKRIASDGIAGHLGRDGKTHAWWWDIWEEYTKQREGQEVLPLIEGLVAEPLDEAGDERQVQDNKTKGLPLQLSNIQSHSEGEKMDGVAISNSAKKVSGLNGTIGHTSTNACI